MDRSAGAAANVAQLTAARPTGGVTLGSMALGGHDLAVRTAENCRVFAGEARGRSPQYEELGLAVARTDSHGTWREWRR